jgi:beta-glucosidase-like glycosyl hydrolase
MIRAGVDIDCVGQHADIELVLRALKYGPLKMADIESALKNSLTVRMRLSHFDPPGPLDMISTTEICSEYAIALARDGAAQGSVLLKNLNRTLPLSKSSLSIAVTGPSANLSRAISNYYGSRSPCHSKHGGQYPNMVDSVGVYAQSVSTCQGVPTVTSTNVARIREAVALAKAADITIVVVGTYSSPRRGGTRQI